MKSTRLMIILLCLSLLTLSPPFVAAERFADLYVGGSFSTDEDFTVSASGGTATIEVDFDSSFTLGYRLGYWFESFPWVGLALEASYFSSDTENIDLYAIPVSGLLMFRLPLMKSNDYPRGQFQPYVGIGPGVFFSSIEYEVARSAVPDLLETPVSGTYSDQREYIGLDVRAGIKKMFGYSSGVFVEYRFTKFIPDFEDNVLGEKVKTEIDLNTHHVSIGFSFSF